MDNKFTDADCEKITKLLNMVGAHATLNLKVGELIQFFHLLSWAQKELLPKMQANVFEITKVTEGSKEE